jgi:uncharacterized NAD-dependent epimerase/dehydratase family protein
MCPLLGFEGVTKELQGTKTGYDHVTEMEQSVKGLEKATEALQKSLQNPNLEANVRNEIESAIQRGQDVMNDMNKKCSGQVFSDTKIGCSSAIFRSKTLGDR